MGFRIWSQIHVHVYILVCITISEQYSVVFQEIPFYGPPRPCSQESGRSLAISKFYEWKVIDCPKVCV